MQENLRASLKEIIDNFDLFLETSDDWKEKDITELAGFFLEMKEDLEIVKEAKTKAQKIFDFVRMAAIPEKMDEEGFDSLDITGVGKIILTGDMHVSILADDKPDFMLWLRENGFGDIITEQINSSTLKAFVKEQNAAGAKLPESVKMTPFTRATVKKK